MSNTSAEWVAKIRASERAERAAKDAREDAAMRDLNDVCAGCGRRWFTVRVAAGGSRPVWIPEARGKWHHACYQRFLERNK